MSDTVRLIKVFISSPSEMADARDAIEHICNEINISMGRRDSFRIEALRWETHSRPSAGPSPQARINEKIGTDYDILIVVLGNTFGTPTESAGSGTEEEYDLARDRYSREGRPDILVYFCDPRSAPGNITAKELARIEDFREKVKSHGATYAEYQSIENLKTLLARHLPDAVLDALKPLELPHNKATKVIEGVEPLSNFLSIEEEEDFGIIELQLQITSDLDAFVSYMSEVGSGVVDLGAEITGITKTLAEINAMDQSSRQRAILRSSDKASVAMDSYTARAMQILPKMHKHFSEGLESMRRVVIIAREDGSVGQGDLEELKLAITAARASIAGALESVEEFGVSVGKIPRMSAAISRSRRTLSAINSDLAAFFRRSISQIDELLLALAIP